MPPPDFAPDEAAAIVRHMNEDHADAVLAICRAFGRAGGAPSPADAAEARMVGIDPAALGLEFVAADGTAGRARVALEPPIDPPGTVRARLVALTRAARARSPKGRRGPER